MATTEPAFDRIRDIVHARTGIVLHPRRRRRIEQRLAAILHTSGIDSLHELAGRLLDDPQCPLHDRIVEAATNHETSFFRDPRLFAALRRRIIPDLLNARQHNRSISIWCAGCSTGQEPYSVAMTLLDAVPRPAEWYCASCRRRPVRVGARHYVASARRGLPALSWTATSRRGDGWTVRPHLRDMVEFRALNLAGPWGDLPMDLILLRWCSSASTPYRRACSRAFATLHPAATSSWAARRELRDSAMVSHGPRSTAATSTARRGSAARQGSAADMRPAPHNARAASPVGTAAGGPHIARAHARRSCVVHKALVRDYGVKKR